MGDDAQPTGSISTSLEAESGDTITVSASVASVDAVPWPVVVSVFDADDNSDAGCALTIGEARSIARDIAAAADIAEAAL